MRVLLQAGRAGQGREEGIATRNKKLCYQQEAIRLEPMAESPGQGGECRR